MDHFVEKDDEAACAATVRRGFCKLILPSFDGMSEDQGTSEGSGE